MRGQYPVAIPTSCWTSIRRCLFNDVIRPESGISNAKKKSKRILVIDDEVNFPDGLSHDSDRARMA
jgi:hypothetical protein